MIASVSPRLAGFGRATEMLSINSLLSAYSNHLSPSWNRSQGLSKLFPSGYSGSISPLQNYVRFVYCQLASLGLLDDQGQTYQGPSDIGNFWVGADGNGNWFFAMIRGECNLNPYTSSWGDSCSWSH
jgi:hypothetical protein